MSWSINFKQIIEKRPEFYEKWKFALLMIDENIKERESVSFGEVNSLLGKEQFDNLLNDVYPPNGLKTLTEDLARKLEKIEREDCKNKKS